MMIQRDSNKPSAGAVWIGEDVVSSPPLSLSLSLEDSSELDASDELSSESVVFFASDELEIKNHFTQGKHTFSRRLLCWHRCHFLVISVTIFARGFFGV